jgi:hypothetical protein
MPKEKHVLSKEAQRREARRNTVELSRICCARQTLNSQPKYRTSGSNDIMDVDREMRGDTDS